MTKKQITQMLIQMASRGQVFGQVSGSPEDYECEQWIVGLRGSGGRLSLGKESGFAFLTKACWDANKELMRKAFKSSVYTWERLESLVEHNLKATKEATIKYVDELKDKIEEAERKLD